MATCEGIDEVDSGDHSLRLSSGVLPHEGTGNSMLESGRTKKRTASEGLTNRSANAGPNTNSHSSWNNLPELVKRRPQNDRLRNSSDPPNIKDNSLNHRDESVSTKTDKKDGTAMDCSEHDAPMHYGAKPKAPSSSYPGASNALGTSSSNYSLNGRLSKSEMKLQGSNSQQHSLFTKRKTNQVYSGASKYSKNFSETPYSSSNKLKDSGFQGDSFDGEKSPFYSNRSKGTCDRDSIVSDCLYVPQDDESRSSLSGFVQQKLLYLNKQRTEQNSSGMDITDFNEGSPSPGYMSYDECDGGTSDNCKLDSDLHLKIKCDFTDCNHDYTKCSVYDSKHSNNLSHHISHSKETIESSTVKPVVIMDLVDPSDHLACLSDSDTVNSSRPPPGFIKQSPRRKKYGIPIAPAYESTKARLKTFTDSKKAFVVPVDKMVDAGLYYVGEGDKTKCFVSGCGLFNWEAGDIPLEEHYRWFPTCEYAKLKKHEPDSLVDFDDCQAVKIALEMGHAESLVRRAYNKCVFEGINCPAAEKLLDVLFELPAEPSDEEKDMVIMIEQLESSHAVLEDQEGEDSGVEDNENEEFSGETATLKIAEIDIQKQRENLMEIDRLKNKLNHLEKAFSCRSCNKKANMCNLPCGHITLCETCVYKNNRCMRCSTLIRGVVKIYVL